MGDLGHLSLLGALLLAALAAATSLLGAWRERDDLLESGRRALYGACALVVVAALALAAAFQLHDFSIRYVAENSSRLMSPLDTLASFWGGQAGSLLFWALGLALLSALSVWRTQRRSPWLVPVMAGTLALILLFFLGILTLIASPFERLPVAPPDGRGLNPILLDTGMRIHPPLLLSGYMSYSVPFAITVAALVTGRLGNDWLRALRPWLLAAWTIQGCGLLAGAWWAYHVLGWGGYWGWDPVENVALLPWLVATALLHSVMVQERRGMLKVWNVGLLLAAFNLSIFGTFVVRSGVISSVHSFAQSAIGPYFFGFLGATLVVTLSLLFYRLPDLRSEGEFDALVSRESSFLFNNLLLVAMTAATFWGTIFPLVSEAIQGTRVAVGPPYFQAVNGPILLALLLLMGIGPLLAWRRSSAASLRRNFLAPIAVGLASGLVLVALGMRQLWATVAFAAAAFVFMTITQEFWRGVRARMRAGEPAPVALVGLVRRNRRRYGGYVVHLGMVFVALGIIGSTFFQQDHGLRLARGESATVGRYTLTNEGLFQETQPGRQEVYAQVAVQADGALLDVIRPGKHTYVNWEQQPTSSISITTTWPWLEDLYVVLVSPNADGSASLQVFVNPLVSLIWLGGVLFLLGTVIAAWPERPRLGTPRPLVSRPQAVAVEA